MAALGPPFAGTLLDDPVRVSAIFGAIAGALSLAVPFFDGLTVALSALLVAIRLGRSVGEGARSKVPVVRIASALAAMAVGWGFFLGAPAPLAGVRGAGLGLAGVLFWWGARDPARSEVRP